MGGELGVAGVEDRLVAVRLGHAGFEVVRDQDGGGAAQELEDPDVGRGPAELRLAGSASAYV